MPLFEPTSSWSPPSTFPDLSAAPWISIDLETNDPHLIEKGPGSIRRDGFIAGVAVVTENFKGYFPIRHLQGQNLPANAVLGWLRDQLKNPNQPKVGANLLYDLEWLKSYDVEIQGAVWDVQLAEPLLDEEAGSYSLDAIAKRRLGKQKNEALLREAAQAWGVDAKAGLWKLPAKFVGPYAEDDARLSAELFLHQRTLLEKNGLMPIYQLEQALIPLLLAMRFRGVRVDVSAAEALAKRLDGQEKELLRKLKSLAGFPVDIWASESINRYAQKAGLAITKTALGNASFTSNWLKNQGDPFCKTLVEARKVCKLRRDFVEGLILEQSINGRVHCQFHPLRKDEEGTRSGRFSSTNPNLQQIPARDKELAPLIRGLFIPEDGCQWAKLDYSQQEPRLLLHYACIRKLERAEEVRARYLENPKTDWYSVIQEATGLSRQEAKTATLGRFYGMGAKKFSYQLNKSEDEAKEILERFDAKFPFIRDLSNEAARVAGYRGYIRTFLGRHRHFELWEPADKDWTKDGEALSLDVAKAKWQGRHIRRAFTHKALNALIQGSAGDMTKKAMLDLWKQGVVPHLTVHDELDFSVESPEQARQYQAVMENCVKLLVPIVAEPALGLSWGAAK